jgi:hypothetical protein
VLFPLLDDWTLFRVETGSWNAASEMGATIELIQMAKASGKMLPARRLLEQRQKKARLEDGKVETRKFVVPALEIRMSKLALDGGHDPERVLVDASTGEILEVPVKELSAPATATAELVNNPSSISRSPDPKKLSEPMVNEVQLKRMNTLFGKLGVYDRNEKHLWVINALGREISTSKELTMKEAKLIMDLQEEALTPNANAFGISTSEDMF